MLKRNAGAVQIGLTATPRRVACGEANDEAIADERIMADNRHYFGEPVYEYGLAQGMEDGYLSACEIRRGPESSLDATGLNLAEIHRTAATRRTGRPPLAGGDRRGLREDRLREAVALARRMNAMCLDLFNHLVQAGVNGGPYGKTIIFCARDRHADAVAIAMNNLYAHWCQSKKLQDARALRLQMHGAPPTATTNCPTSAARPVRTSSPPPWTC